MFVISAFVLPIFLLRLLSVLFISLLINKIKTDLLFELFGARNFHIVCIWSNRLLLFCAWTQTIIIISICSRIFRSFFLLYRQHVHLISLMVIVNYRIFVAFFFLVVKSYKNTVFIWMRLFLLRVPFEREKGHNFFYAIAYLSNIIQIWVYTLFPQYSSLFFLVSFTINYRIWNYYFCF